MSEPEEIPSNFPAPVERPSKTDLKRVQDRLKIFADELVNLPAGRLARLTLPDEVMRSLKEARRLESRAALKRQLQHLTSLLESVDAGEVRRTLAAMDHAPAKPKAPPVPENPLAATLLAGGDEAVFALSERYARDELQTLRQAVRTARKQLESKGDRVAALAAISSCLARFA